jgi:hypothetical protein
MDDRSDRTDRTDRTDGTDGTEVTDERSRLIWAPNPKKLDDGWPESEKNVFQTALVMVVVQK